MPLPFAYDEVELDPVYRADIVVEDAVILERKAVEQLHPLHDVQLMTYLKISGLRVGLLINFNVVSLKDGTRRRVM
jgi:hypothetical protein